MDGASKIAAKAIALIDFMALSCLTFSLDNVIIDPRLVDAIAIAIVHGNCEGHYRRISLCVSGTYLFTSKVPVDSGDPKNPHRTF